MPAPGHLHVLRELVHLSCAWLPREPRLEVKYALGAHVHDDARSAAALAERIEPGAPADALAGLLARTAAAATPDDYEELAYGRLKPTLATAARAELDRLDPLAGDDGALQTVTELAHRQERHVLELPPRAILPLAPEALAAAPGAARPLDVTPAAPGAREPFVPLAPVEDDALQAAHDALQADLVAAERLARAVHEQPQADWPEKVELTRRIAEHLRAAADRERLMAAELDGHWGARGIPS